MWSSMEWPPTCRQCCSQWSGNLATIHMKLEVVKNIWAKEELLIQQGKVRKADVGALKQIPSSPLPHISIPILVIAYSCTYM